MSWFKKKRKGEKNMASTLEEVRKAYEDLSDDDKKEFHQSIADHVHENVEAQEEGEGGENTQSAEDREHEALGEEHADEENENDPEEKQEEVSEPEEHEPAEEKEEGAEEGTLKEILERLGNIEADLAVIKSGKGKEVHEASKEDSSKLDKIASIYEN